MTRRGLHLASGSLLMVALLGACGSSGDDSSSTTAPGTSAPASTAAPTAAPTEAATSTAATETSVDLGPDFDEAAARAAVTEMWETFLNKDSSLEARIALVENGDQLNEAITAVQENPLISQATTKVTDVTFESATRAIITYDILVGGAVALPNGQAVAVLTEIGWQVSVETFCGLAQLALGTPPPGC